MDIPDSSIAEQKDERKPTLREIIEIEFSAAYGDYKVARQERNHEALLRARARMDYLVKRLAHGKAGS